jgi:hypothetical protein
MKSEAVMGGILCALHAAAAIATVHSSTRAKVVFMALGMSIFLAVIVTKSGRGEVLPAVTRLTSRM